MINITNEQLYNSLIACTVDDCANCAFHNLDEECMNYLHVVAARRIESLYKKQHGHWLDCGNGFSACSVCGNMHFGSVEAAKRVGLYCDHCGSKMDEEVSE